MFDSTNFRPHFQQHWPLTYMSEHLRQFLVVMLVCLQMAAPLVHAHAGTGDWQRGGLHLHELERYSDKLADVGCRAVDESGNIDSKVVIDIDSVLRPPHKTRAYFAQSVVWQGHMTSFATEIQSETINFSPHRLLIPVPPIPNHQTSRAPPRLFI